MSNLYVPDTRNLHTEVQGVLATDDNMGAILASLHGADDIAVDTETTGLNVRNNIDYLLGVCVDVPGLSAYIPFRHQSDNVSRRFLEPLVRILRTKPLIWHNLKFDFHSFKTLGVDPLEFTGLQFDTLLLATLNNEELFSKQLGFLCNWYLKVKAKEDKVYDFGKAVGFDKTTPAMWRQQGAQDAFFTRRLRDFLYPSIVAQELDAVYWDTELPYAKLLYKLEQRGVGRDARFCEDKSERGRGRMATIQRKLKFNPASSPDLGRYLIQELELPVLAHTDTCPKCGKGAKIKEPVSSHTYTASFKKTVMEEYDDILFTPAYNNNEAAQLITEYRGWSKAVSSLYEPVIELAGPDDKIRTEFQQHRTVTGRLSATNPNLQQVPRSSPKVWNGNAKSAFNSARDEYVLYGWDYSQIELRLAATYGREKVLLTEFEQEKADPFNVLAPLIFGHLDPETRHKTKNGFVYPSLYGAGLGKVALSVGLSEEQTRPLYQRYLNSIPGIIAVSRQVQTLVEQRGYVKYWDGRRRHIRNRSDAFKAWNSVLQGGAAQLMKKAMLRCEEFENEDCFMVLSVHDEITFIIRENLIMKYEPLIIHAMTDWDFGVNLHVEGKEWK